MAHVSRASLSRAWYPHRPVPTILYEQGFRFFIYPADRREPPHIHVFRGGGSAKWWLNPVREQCSNAFSRSERARIRHIIQDHHGYLLDQWRRVFPENR